MDSKISKGEQKVMSILQKNHIPYKREVSFNDLVGKKKVSLRYDFGIYNKGQLICLIEFDGRQHYEFTPYFHKKRSDFLKQKERDRQKNKYCLMHNIPLIRIPYWDLENLTLEKIFTEPSYKVTTKFHLDKLIQDGVKK